MPLDTMALAAPTTASAGAGGGPTGARGRIDSTSSEMSADGTIMALAELVRAALGLQQSVRHLSAHVPHEWAPVRHAVAVTRGWRGAR